MASTIVLPSGDEVYLAADFWTDIAEIGSWLDHMVSTAGFLDDNANSPVVLVPGARAYIHNQLGTIYKKLEFCIDAGFPSFAVDRVLYAVYPPSPEGHRSLAVSEFVGYLGRLAGREKLHEVLPWAAADQIGPEMRRMPATIPFPEIQDAVASLGYSDPGDLVRRYHLALNYLERKHFVILTGLSGTGKTLLSIRYAQAVHGITDPERRDPLLFICPVRPDWTDPTGVLGYYDMISNRYQVPPFLQALLAAHRYEQSPVFACLDEMNLARVEYYLAEVLSAMETAQSAGEAGVIHLHDSSVPREGSNGEEIPRSISLPPNLFLIGTVNVDETTHPLSPKVLDRAVVIDTTNVRLSEFLEDLKTRHSELSPSVDACVPTLAATEAELAPHGLGFAYRVAEEFVRYHHFALQIGGQTSQEIIDDQLVQKVLVKLRGTHEQEGMLRKLRQDVLKDYPDSIAVIERLERELAEFHSFQNTR